MIDVQAIRDDPEAVGRALARRGIEAPLARVIELDAQRRKRLGEVEALKAERNRVSKAIAGMTDEATRAAEIERMRALGDQVEALDGEVRNIEANLDRLLSEVPNPPAADTPDGRSEEDNVVRRQVGEPGAPSFALAPHWDLGESLGLLDFERGVKISGSRFYVLRGAGARLERALIAWMLDLHVRQGYTECYLPFVVKEQTMYGAGQLPKFHENLYRDAEDDVWLVPTAEVPLTGMHAGEILDGSALPLRYTAYTPCFRREKMSAGRDVRGIKRGHQFDKVEMYAFCAPEHSDDELERMLADAEATCAGLGLVHRVKQLCAGDLGFSARKSYDVEVWAPAAGEWLEVSSVSNCGDFQARRSNIRYRPAGGGKARLVHTLNGSGLGLPRTLIAVLENYQQADGSVVVPDVLRPWMGGVDVVRRDV
ncbi:MAG TPA: serine--tRNA ligase [Anaerolineales bacterium]|nr:serine--tRNA ligase [Anaerolineales bacterium]